MKRSCPQVLAPGQSLKAGKDVLAMIEAGHDNTARCANLVVHRISSGS
ncbi:MAG: hypothetical protein HYS23_01705 [Geobacter sp.]|nr:hypothetical protein [Geobacter sp.]